MLESKWVAHSQMKLIHALSTQSEMTDRVATLGAVFS